MFFNSNNISFEITSVFHLNQEVRNACSDVRPFCALSFRCSGNTEFVNKNGITKAKTGDIAFVPAFYDFRQIALSKESLFVVHFVSDIAPLDTIKKFSPANPDYFKIKFENLYNSWLKKQAGFEYECKSILYIILMIIEVEDSKSNLMQDVNKIDEAIDYIHDNYTSQNITVESLAKMCSMSDTYFRKLFYKRFSQTPLKYINNMKLSYALELLRSGYYTVSEVSNMCNFDNVYYFSNFIKQNTNRTPSEHILR